MKQSLFLFITHEITDFDKEGKAPKGMVIVAFCQKLVHNVARWDII